MHGGASRVAPMATTDATATRPNWADAGATARRRGRHQGTRAMAAKRLKPGNSRAALQTATAHGNTNALCWDHHHRSIIPDA
ncbi:hypothetical protein E2562_011735 [Oryza meyeriana var. granulata]|uniref:Uncharacterized protein n=1 Tax=Oryza meyeriana var. granulata TaxID=110450 RepID=A0A6G1DH35_9ORYZ|nr:hypothetical protein E2562_011735 [Oryza meyeriana var. granulata]